MSEEEEEDDDDFLNTPSYFGIKSEIPAVAGPDLDLQAMIDQRKARRQLEATVLREEEKKTKEQRITRKTQDETEELTESVQNTLLQALLKQDAGPLPCGFLPVTTVLPANATNTITTATTTEELLLTQVFLAPLPSQSQAQFDALMGPYYVSSFAIVSHIKNPLEISPSFLVSLLDQCTRSTSDNVRRGLTLLHARLDLFCALVKFASYPISLAVSVPLSLLLNRFAARSEQKTLSAAARDFLLEWIEQEKDENQQLFRVVRLGKLFTSSNSQPLFTLWISAWITQKWPAQATTILSQVLFAETSKRKQLPQDFHRWTALVHVIEFRLRQCDQTTRNLECEVLANCEARINSGSLFASAHVLKDTIRTVMKLYQRYEVVSSSSKQMKLTF